MFINPNVFKKLATAAWKNEELTIGHIADEYVISGRMWIMHVMEKYMTNKVRAILIELIGEFPEAGYAYTYGKSCDAQQEMPESIPNNDNIYIIPGLACESTHILITRDGVIQHMYQDELGGKHLINAIYSSMIRQDYIEEEKGEVSYYTPYKRGEWMLWSNNIMSFSCHTRNIKYIKEKAAVDALADIDLVYNEIGTETLAFRMQTLKEEEA
jgi:hypothetical protein